jgi:hypothetical protein
MVLVAAFGLAGLAGLGVSTLEEEQLVKRNRRILKFTSSLLRRHSRETMSMRLSRASVFHCRASRRAVIAGWTCST